MYDDILTGIMQQPQRDPNAYSSSQDGEETHLPSGPKPTIFILEKRVEKLSDNELTWNDLLISSFLPESVIEYIDPDEQNFALIYMKSKQRI